MARSKRIASDAMPAPSKRSRTKSSSPQVIGLTKPSGGGGGQATEIEIQAREILYIRNRLNEVISHHTGQPVEKIERDHHAQGDGG